MLQTRKIQAQKLEKEDFITYYGNEKYYSKIFGIHNEYEIVLNPCDLGFDVFLYRRKPAFELERIGRERCTALAIYKKLPEHIIWGETMKIVNMLIAERLPEGIER